ncbi:MAG TPA: cupin domain-containing protein [Nannocystaceae bacterium]|nr:cupin domain-containing protein [Nannocystaceae bacterium]
MLAARARSLVCALALGCRPDASTSATPLVLPPAPPVPPPPSAGILGAREQEFPSAIACDGELDRVAVKQAIAALAHDAGAAQLVVTVRPGRTCTLPALPSVDAMIVAVAGSGNARGVEEASARQLARWDAIHAPGLGVELATRTPGITLVLALAPTSGTLGAAIDGAAWADRPAPLARIELRESEELAWGEDKFRVRIGFGAPESPNLSLAILHLDADATVPLHEHAETEVITTIDGASETTVAGTTHEVAVGSTIAIPPKTQHGVRTTTSPVLVVQTYAPAGPEQRFRKLAADAKSPQ